MTSPYTPDAINKMHKANPDMLGVRLGKICLRLDIPVEDVAEHLGVNHNVVRAWFYGTVGVSAGHADQISDIIKKLS